MTVRRYISCAVASRWHIVERCTLKIRAASATVFRSLRTISVTSARCICVSFGLWRSLKPLARACSSPAIVRSRIIWRSNSAKQPTICIIIRPAGVVVSIASVRLLKSAPLSENLAGGTQRKAGNCHRSPGDVPAQPLTLVLLMSFATYPGVE